MMTTPLFTAGSLLLPVERERVVASGEAGAAGGDAHAQHACTHMSDACVHAAGIFARIVRWTLVLRVNPSGSADVV